MAPAIFTILGIFGIVGAGLLKLAVVISRTWYTYIYIYFGEERAGVMCLYVNCKACRACAKAWTMFIWI